MITIHGRDTTEEIVAENMRRRRELKQNYLQVKDKIEIRLNQFRRIWKYGTEHQIFTELVFCLLTPQSRAQPCWDAACTIVNHTKDGGMLEKAICRKLSRVRFKNKKSRYVARAWKQFSRNGRIFIRAYLEKCKHSYQAREWLAQNVKGIGYKEASHFLRNIGLGSALSILDRHVLRNLKQLGIIEKIPGSLTDRQYIYVEQRMRQFSKSINIPLDHLDLLLWYRENGDIFK